MFEIQCLSDFELLFQPARIPCTVYEQRKVQHCKDAVGLSKDSDGCGLLLWCYRAKGGLLDAGQVIAITRLLQLAGSVGTKKTTWRHTAQLIRTVFFVKKYLTADMSCLFTDSRCEVKGGGLQK